MEQRCAPDFKALLARENDIELLEIHTGSVVGLRADASIAYVNPAWVAFAQENGGGPAIRDSWGLGRSYLESIRGPLRLFYEGLLQNAAIAEESLHPPVHEYECSSARVYRRFAMHIYAFPKRSGWLIVNSLLAEFPHGELRIGELANFENYVSTAGLITQCANCRRVRHAVEHERWDWVPTWIEHPVDGVSHGMCPICVSHYWPKSSDASTMVPVASRIKEIGTDTSLRLLSLCRRRSRID